MVEKPCDDPSFAGEVLTRGEKIKSRIEPDAAFFILLESNNPSLANSTECAQGVSGEYHLQNGCRNELFQELENF